MDNKLPKRPRAHIIGDRAGRVFGARCKPEWVTNEVQKDYGWDILVYLTKEGKVTSEDFFVQLKGSDSLAYVNHNTAISHSLKTQTINWLLGKPMPSMLCVCDTSKTDEPIYWIWLQEAIKEISKNNPTWINQKELSIRIPTGNIFSSSKHNEIESYVKNYYTDLRHKAAIGEVLSPSSEGEPNPTQLFYRNETNNIIKEPLIGSLKEAGLVDITEDGIKLLAPEDQKRHQELVKASSALKELRDNDAKNILDDLEPQIDDASDGIRARYFNGRGVLELHLDNLESALTWFEKARSLHPAEIKYQTNHLAVQYHLADSPKENLPQEWIKNLEIVLSKQQNFCPAIRLKTYWLRVFKGVAKAEEFIQKSPAWKKEPAETKACLAEIYKNDGNNDKALSLLEDAEKLGLPLDGLFWSLYGFVLFRKSTGGQAGDSNVYGFGSNKLNLDYLNKAAGCYDKAIDAFMMKGLPRLAEQAIVNQCSVLILLGKPADGEHACKIYVDKYPDVGHAQGALASLLFHQNKFTEAIPYAQKALELKPSFPVTYKNLAILLLLADEFEKLLALIVEREKTGFLNKDEEGVSRVLVTASYCELGKHQEAEKQLAILKSNKEFSIAAILAEAEVVRRNGGDKDKIIAVYRSALKSHPDEIKLLTHIILLLNPAVKETASEIIEYTQRILTKNQLIPEAFFIFGRALHTLGKLEEAKQAFSQAIKRYPNEHRFLCELANVYLTEGDEESAYAYLQKYLEYGKSNHSLLCNMAVIAFDTGRLNESIALFQKALGKSNNPKERGKIHCQLYELKKRRKDPQKDILRHAVEYGKTIEKDDLKSEAQFLTMALLSPGIPDSDKDADVERWVQEIRTRSAKFSQEHPDFPSFQRIDIPEGLTDEGKRTYILTKWAELSLPHRLASVPIEISARHEIWPLVFRAQHLAKGGSLFDVWSEYTHQKDFSRAIHIFRGDINPLETESNNAMEPIACIDITALLTLAGLDLLNYFSSTYQKIVIARGTKITLDKEQSSVSTIHPLVAKIEQWRLANRSKIRIRNITAFQDESEEDNHEGSNERVLLSQKKSLDVLYGCGVGETLLLAHELTIPLYSDESIIRYWGMTEYNTKSFSTVGFINRLEEEGTVSQHHQIDLFARMIKKNFWVIPVEPRHLLFRLKEIIDERNQKSLNPPKRDDLLNDDILGVFLRQFGEVSIRYQYFVPLAVDWWILILIDNNLSGLNLTECMHYPIFAFTTTRFLGGVQSRIIKDEPEIRIGSILALFLYRAYLKEKHEKAWSAIKSFCEDWFSRDEPKYRKVVFNFIPRSLVKAVEANDRLTEDQKINHLVDLPIHFSENERKKFETEIRKHYAPLRQ